MIPIRHAREFNRNALLFFAFLLVPLLPSQAQNSVTNGSPVQGIIPDTKSGIPKPVVGGTAAVKVVDAVTQLPLPGVQVQVEGPQSFTDLTNRDGIVFFFDLEKGSYTVTFSLAEYQPNVISMEVNTGDFIVLASDVVRLVPKSSGGPLMNLFLTVRDENSRILIDNPSFSLDPKVGVDPVEVSTGVYAYLIIPIVDYEMVVKAEGYVDEVVSISNPNLLEDVEVLMTPVNPLINLNCNGSENFAFNGLNNAMADLFVLGLSLLTLTAIGCLRG